LNGDLILIFQNYWKWKRDLVITFNITIRDESGDAIYESTNNKPKLINSISIKELFKKYIPNQFVERGVVEIEIFSKDNIVFPFPAVMGFYKSKNSLTSAVHTAGRTLEKPLEEEHFFSETNFFISTNKNFRPFVNIFNGPSGAIKDLRILIMEKNNPEPIKVINETPLLKPYESRTIFIDNKNLSNKNKHGEVNNLSIFDDAVNYFLKIQGKYTSIFPRFVCGNLDIINKHYCVTHTYREIDFSGDKLENCFGIEKRSSVSLPLVKDVINLKTVIYPTSSSEENSVSFHLNKLDDLQKESISFVKDLSVKKCGLNSIIIDSEKTSGFFLSAAPNNKSGELPARIHVNCMYYLKNKMKTLPSDISHQLTAHLSKPKSNYWFNGIVSKGYKNLILGSSVTSESFLKRNSEPIEFSLIIRLEKKDINLTKFYKFGGDGNNSFVLCIEDIFRKENIKIFDEDVFSWRIVMKEGKMGAIYCLSYNEELGCIYGEHSF